MTRTTAERSSAGTGRPEVHVVGGGSAIVRSGAGLVVAADLAPGGTT